MVASARIENYKSFYLDAENRGSYRPHPGLDVTLTKQLWRTSNAAGIPSRWFGLQSAAREGAVLNISAPSKAE